MRALKYIISVWSLLWIALYISGASINANLNIAQWGEESRSVLFGLFAGLALTVVVVVFLTEDPKQSSE